VIAYLTAIATLVGIRALLTWASTSSGADGLVNLGVVAFFAVGAYTAALFAVSGVASAGLGRGGRPAATAGAMMAMVALRLREDYLAIVTLGFAESCGSSCSTRRGSPGRQRRHRHSAPAPWTIRPPL
jgi:ABC-type branched-subunit amino acid transport system permease subunit